MLKKGKICHEINRLWNEWRKSFASIGPTAHLVKDVRHLLSDNYLSTIIPLFISCLCVQQGVAKRLRKTYILKAGFHGFWNPQMTLNFLRALKLSIWVPENCQFCNVSEMKVTKCWKILPKSPNSLIIMFMILDLITFCFQMMHF